VTVVGRESTFSEPRIVVVGSCNVDLTSYLPHVPGPGETVIGNSFSIGFGGKGANQALMARRLGAQVVMVGCVGRDSFGDMIVANLAENGIDTTWLGRTAAVGTGVAVVWVEPDGTNRIAYAPGANDLVSEAQAAEAVAAILPAVVLGQFEIPQAVTRAAFAAARRVGAITVLNPAPAAALDRELRALTDWLVPNEVELAQLTSTTSTADDALLAAADRISADRLLVTQGAAGVALVDHDSVLRLPAPEVNVVDTTGAGDVLIGAFGFGLARGMSPAAAAELGMLCASDSVQRRGAQAAMPTTAEAVELLAPAASGRSATGAPATGSNAGPAGPLAPS
jgi:ribokinase